MTVDEYLLSCKLAKLNIQELEYMTVGSVLDYLECYYENTNPNAKKERDATQEDINRLKGR